MKIKKITQVFERAHTSDVILFISYDIYICYTLNAF